MIDKIKNIGNSKGGSDDSPISAEVIASIANGLSGESLRSNEKTLYVPNSEALISHVQEVGLNKHGVQLNALIIAGDTVFGVVNDYEQQYDSPAKVNGVSLVQIPIGLRADETSKLVASVDADTLNNPREEGYIKNWEEITIGRGVSPESIDPKMSRQHFELTVAQSGREIKIKDQASTNGTQVIDLQTISRASAEGNHGNAEQMIELRNYLQDHPHRWLPDYTGKKIVYQD